MIEYGKILHLLKCPSTGSALRLEGRKLISVDEDDIQYDIDNNIIRFIDEGAKLGYNEHWNKYGDNKVSDVKITHGCNFIEWLFCDFDKEIGCDNIIIDIDVAAEYYVDIHFEELIDKEDILTIGENHVLFEFSYLNKPLNYKKILIKLFEKGYKPILAHPERYLFFQEDKKGFDELKEMGVQFQLNMFSLIGAYDKASQYHGRRLIEKGMIDYIGSDIHRAKQLHLLERSLTSRYMHHLVNKCQLKNIYLGS